MNRTIQRVLWGVLILAVLLCIGGCGRKSENVAQPKETIQDIPGIDLAGLDGAERSMVLKTMNEYVCQYGCAKGLTIAEAQAKDKNCLISKRLAEIVIENVKAGKAMTIEEEITRIVKGADYAASPPPEEIYSIAVGDAPTKGPKDAPVTILIFSDFQ